MMRGRRERHRMNVKRILARLSWMFKVKDCWHVCLFCEHFDMCKENGITKRRKNSQMNMKYAIRSEDTEQIGVVQWAEWNMNSYPELKWLHHVPNGGSRNKSEAVKLKQMGVKSGVSDLCLPYPKGIYCGLYIEMKYGSNRQQPTQKEFLTDMAAAGHFVATCYSAEEAVKVIEEYCKLPENMQNEVLKKLCVMAGISVKDRSMSFPNNSILKDGKVKGGGAW